MNASCLQDQIDKAFFGSSDGKLTAVVPLLFACAENNVLKQHVATYLSSQPKLTSLTSINLSTSTNRSKYESLSVINDTAFSVLLDIITNSASTATSATVSSTDTGNSPRSLKTSNRNVLEISIGFSAIKITMLDLTWCSRITDTSVTYMCKLIGHSLTHINLSFTDITDKSIEDLVTTCKFLLDVSIGGCQVTDKSLDKLAQCTSLQVLDIHFCRQLTEKKIFNCVKRLSGHSLIKIDVSDCEITEKMVNKMEGLNSKLTVTAPKGDTTISSPVSYRIDQ
jgi:hypothetical protein